MTTKLIQLEPIVNPETEFPLVEKMIYNLAWKYANTYPVTFEEAKTEAYYAFVRACYDFKPDRNTKFSSWCYTWVWQHLKTWITKRTVDPLIPTEINEELVGAAPEERSRTLEMMEDLSDDAQEIIHLILEAPSEVLGGMPATPKQLLSRVKTFLVERRGKDKNRVDQAHREIVQVFQEAWA